MPINEQLYYGRFREIAERAGRETTSLADQMLRDVVKVTTQDVQTKVVKEFARNVRNEVNKMAEGKRRENMIAATDKILKSIGRTYGIPL